MVNSFYDPQLEEGCAFEELISFHGGMGGPQTRPFILHPVTPAVPGGADRRRRGGPRLLAGWRRFFQDEDDGAAQATGQEIHACSVNPDSAIRATDDPQRGRGRP